MKKNVWPVLALMSICALFMFSCGASELEEKAKLDDVDLVLEGGRVAYYFDTPRIQKGKTYIVTFDMEACDESFIGNRMGGKLSYEDAGDTAIPVEGPPLVSPTEASEEFYIVAGWDYCMPNVILDRPMKYKWTFTGGEQQRDNKPLFKEKDGSIMSDWQKVPDDKAQFFLLIAQTPAWKNFGKFTEFGVKLGSEGINIREKVMPTGTLTMVPPVITLDDKNNTTGAGVIRTDYSRLTSAYSADKYAFIRVYMRGCSLNGTDIEERKGVAAIGNLDNMGSTGSIDPNAMVLAPAANTVRPDGVAEEDFSETIPARGGNNLNFYVDLDIEDLLLFRKSTNESSLTVKVSVGRLDRIELYTYQL